jgi:hypothetical protein
MSLHTPSVGTSAASATSSTENQAGASVRIRSSMDPSFTYRRAGSRGIADTSIAPGQNRAREEGSGRVTSFLCLVPKPDVRFRRP